MVHIVNRVALITGVTGQDGAYLAEFLLAKGYEVHGIKRRSSQFNTARIDHIYQDPHDQDRRLVLHYGDLTDASNLIRIVQQTQPDEIYNLGAMSHVQVSYEMPEYTADANALGTLRILEAIRLLNLTQKTRFYQASTSELFGQASSSPQNEATPFQPRSPYGASKLFSYWTTIIYRQAYQMFAANGILFNHESPLRGETFSTRKISRAVARIYLGMQDRLYLGNLDATRDWGHAKDYVEGMWLMLQQDQPDDYVLATGESASIRDFVRLAFEQMGIEVAFNGKGLQETAEIVSTRDDLPHLKAGQTVVCVDERYFRPTEIDNLLGDASKARRQLGWEPRYSLRQLAEEMVRHDLNEAIKEKKSLA